MNREEFKVWLLNNTELSTGREEIRSTVEEFMNELIDSIVEVSFEAYKKGLEEGKISLTEGL